MRAGDGSSLTVQWADAVAALAGPGWARAPQAFNRDLASRLAKDDGRKWRVARDEGVVHQHVIGLYTPFGEAPETVRAIGDELVKGLSAEADSQGLPPVPQFNEATWGKYPPGTGHITAHRDPAGYGGVVAVFTLYGRAPFRAWGPDEEVSEWETGPGQLVIMRGTVWPWPGSRCPLHEVEPPHDHARMIMTLRHNLGGAGAG